MEDILTETPPPSRFFQDDLHNFAAPPPPLPPPLLLPNPNPNPNPNPSLLVLALSAASLAAVHRIRNKTLAGTLILPETPLSGSPLASLPFCPVYSLDLPAKGPAKAVVVAVQTPVAAERARDVARSVLGAFGAEKVLILDDVRSGNYRGRLGVDETLAFRVESVEERRAGDRMVVGVEDLPSGSVMDGLGAAAIGECQMRGVRGVLVGTWPAGSRAGPGTVRRVVSVLRGLGIDVEENVGGEEVAAGFGGGSSYDSDLYT